MFCHHVGLAIIALCLVASSILCYQEYAYSISDEIDNSTVIPYAALGNLQPAADALKDFLFGFRVIYWPYIGPTLFVAVSVLPIALFAILNMAPDAFVFGVVAFVMVVSCLGDALAYKQRYMAVQTNEEPEKASPV